MADRSLPQREASLLAVFAHPDDETFRPGGTLALLARSGVRVGLLTATHGEAGSCGKPPLCAPEEGRAIGGNASCFARVLRWASCRPACSITLTAAWQM